MGKSISPQTSHRRQYSTLVAGLSEVEAKKLLLKLLQADSEAEVTGILDAAGYLESKEYWQPLGQTEGNWGIVGNQQSQSAPALADKIVNSVDAVLTSECWRAGLTPDSSSAPKSMEEAVEKFFGIPGGKLTNATQEQRKGLSERVFLIASGARPGDGSGRSLCYTLIDTGEGQPPSKMCGTLLSLPSQGKPNKSKIRFVQGLFNMGGTGVLPFCGTQNYELILSKRCPWVSSAQPDSNKWSFTIIRRLRPSEDERISVYQYLAPGGDLLTISDETLPILPGKYPSAYSEAMTYGTCIKLYEYGIKPDGLRSPATLALYYELSRQFYSLAIPIRICERREGYLAHSSDITLAGMAVRLEDDRSGILEEGFPTGGSMPVSNVGDLPVTVCVFKHEIGRDGTRRQHWMGDKGIMFILNGQMHAFYRSDFFSRQSVDLGYLEKDLMIIVDFTNVPINKREDLLMPSRDRIREGQDRDAIENALEEFLHDHEGLRAFNEKRRQEELQAVFGADKPLEKVLGKLLKHSPTLANLFGFGQQLSKPTSFDWTERVGNYHGKTFPTFFRLATDESKVKQVPSNSVCRFYFETDAVNDYFVRSRKPGIFLMVPNDVKKSFKLWNGIATLTLKPRPVAGTRIDVSVQVTDSQRKEPFPEIHLELIVEPPVVPNKWSKGGQSQQIGGVKARFKKLTDGGDSTKGLSLPKIEGLWKDVNSNWADHFNSDYDACDPVPHGHQLDIFVNMSNPYLKTEVEISNQPGEKFVLENQFKYGLALLSLAMYHDNLETTKQAEPKVTEPLQQEVDILSEIRKATRGAAMVILPVANNLNAATKSAS